MRAKSFKDSQRIKKHMMATMTKAAMQFMDTRTKLEKENKRNKNNVEETERKQ